MKVIKETSYYCSFCDRKFSDEETCKSHEEFKKIVDELSTKLTEYDLEIDVADLVDILKHKKEWS